MNAETLLRHATRFVIGNRLVINLFFDCREKDALWQVHEMPEFMKLGKKLGDKMTLEKAVEMATKGTT